MPASPSPTPAGIAPGLGYLAIVPFVAGAALVWIVDGSWHAPIAQALSAYAAVVIAFIGALHWGLAFPQPAPAPRLFVWGVIPSLVAWVAVLLPPPIGLVIHAVMLVVCYLVDRVTYPQQAVGTWLPLRLQLTIFATASCLTGAAGS